MIDILTPFKDTQYTFSSVFADNESIQLLKAIDYVLQRAGWKRGASIGGFPSIAPFEDKKYGVPAALSDGLLISMESTQEISVLKATHINLLPAPLGAAIALRQALASDLSPPEESSAMIDVEKGTSMTIKISVGKKR
jgi:hypothetical protein